MKIWILSKYDDRNYENGRLLAACRDNGVEVGLVRPDQQHVIITKKKVPLPDVVLTRTGSGSNYYGLAFMRELERQGVRCINSSRAIEVAKDKFQTAQVLAKHDIAVPKVMLLKPPVDVEVVREEIGFPCVIKVLSGSHGRGVYMCESASSFPGLMDLIKTVGGGKKTILCQEFVAARPGTDLRVWVINGRVVGAMQRIGAGDDFRANISNGGTGRPYPVTLEVEQIATATANALNLEIAGIDLLFTENGFTVCEANSAPGFVGFEQYCEADIADLIIKSLMKMV